LDKVIGVKKLKVKRRRRFNNDLFIAVLQYQAPIFTKPPDEL